MRAGRPPRGRKSGCPSIDDNVYVSFRCWESDAVAPGRQRDAARLQRHLAGQRSRRLHASTPSTTGATRVLFTSTRSADGRTGRSPTSGSGTATGIRSGTCRPGRFDGGWTVEAAIPFKSLRYRPARQQTWGFNALRINRWKNEISLITPVPSGAGAAGAAAGVARADAGRHRSAAGARRNLDIKPYVDLRPHERRERDVTRCRTISAATSASTSSTAITQNLTADFTVQHRLRAGRGRRAAGQPHPVQPVLSGEARVLPREPGACSPSAAPRPAGRRSASSDTPILFYSRRIGLDDGPVGPDPRRRARHRARRPLQLRPAEHPHRPGRCDVERRASTNFAVVRVKRDILRRSSVGAARHRPLDRAGRRRRAQPGATASTATFGFFDNLNINTYWARTQTDGLSGDDTSYRAQFDYTGDRYGLQLERLSVGEDFNPEVGFVRRDDMRRTFGERPLQPARPRASTSIRKLLWSGSIDYIENGAGRLETRDSTASSASSSRTATRSAVEYTRTYEFLPRPFRDRPGIDAAGRRLRLRHRQGRLQHRAAARVSAQLCARTRHASTTATGRAFSVEPRPA